MTKSAPPPPPEHREIVALIEQELHETPVRLEVLKSGAWSSALSVTTNTREYIVRFAASADDFRCDANAARFSSAQLPIPNVYAIGLLDDRWWCISDRMPGVHLDDLTEEDFGRTIPSIANMLIAIRDADASGTTGYGGWNEDGNGNFPTFADQLLNVSVDTPEERGGGWRAVLNDQPYELDVFQRGVQVLHHLSQFVPNTRQLIHQDTINFNVTVVGNQISGVFDWGCAMWGDALYDLAWFRFWDPWYPDRQHLRIPEHLEVLVGIEGDHQAERMRCYLLHIGLMHIRYNAFIGYEKGMNDVARETEKLLDEMQ